MNVDLIFKIAGVGIIVTVLHMLLKQSGREDQAVLVTIGGLVVVFLMLIGEIGNLFDTIRTVFGL